MQDNPNITDDTDDTHEPIRDLLIEREDWELAFEPFEGNAYAALKLGSTLAMLRTFLEGQLFKSGQVIEALNEAMEVVFPYTEFHDASFTLFVRFAEGKLTYDEEQMLTALGVKF
jgi:hypothetical protein